MTVERRAIGANHFGFIAHVKEDMRMIERRSGADAHKFPGTDLDHRHAGIIVKMGDNMIHHGVLGTPRNRAEAPA